MDSIRRERVVAAVSVAASLAAVAVLTDLPGWKADQLLVACVASIAVLVIVDGSRGPGLSGLPALMLVQVLSPDGRVRLLGFGVVLALVVLIVGVRWLRTGTTTLARGAVLVLCAVAPARALPLEADGLVSVLIVLAGAVAVVAAGSRKGRASLDVLLIAFASATIAPLEPVQAAMFPFVLAALIRLLRVPDPFTVGSFAIAVLFGGKWYAPVAIAVAVAFLYERYRNPGEPDPPESCYGMGVPFVSGLPTAAGVVAASAFAPDVALRARTASRIVLVTVSLLVLAAVFVQPSLATMYILVAIGALACVDVTSTGETSTAAISFSLPMICLTAWGGALVAGFPLPIPPAVLALLALTAVGARLVKVDPALASSIVAGAAATAILLHPAAELGRVKVERVARDIRLSSGQSISVDLPPDASNVRLVLNGGNIADAKPGSVLGIAIMEPGGVRHELRSGDFADWGATRSSHYLSSDNPRLWYPRGAVLERGRNAFRTGTGVVRIPVVGEKILIEASEALGGSGRLTIVSVEVER